MAVLLPLAIVGLFLLRGVASFATDYCMARAGRSVVRDLREEVLGKYLRLPSARYDQESVPAMVSRLNFDTEQVTSAATDALKTIVTDGLTILYLLGVMLATSVKVTLAMVLIAPLIGVLVWYVGKRYRKISRGIQDGMGGLAHSAEQSLSAQQDVKAYGARGSMARYSSSPTVFCGNLRSSPPAHARRRCSDAAASRSRRSCGWPRASAAGRTRRRVVKLITRDGISLVLRLTASSDLAAHSAASACSHPDRKRLRRGTRDRARSGELVSICVAALRTRSRAYRAG